MTSPAFRILRCLLFSLLAVGLARPLAVAADNEVPAEHIEFFETKIRPMLVENCFECHSNKSKAIMGGLRLDSRQAMLTGGDSGHAVVPGKPQDSSLVKAVRWQDFEMPPKGKLSDPQVALLVKWVEMGAPWPEDTSKLPVAAPSKLDWNQLRSEHWAFQPVRRPEVPAVKDAAWPKNALDHFVLARLEAAAIVPAAPARPRVLARRLYFDLIGFPPTPGEVDEFVKEYAAAPDAALTSLADRLLASPHYGERWGRHWLDVARYSDGYGGFLDGAGLPHAWRYRDWVVKSLNDDMPYNEFIRLQLTGDLESPELAVATGFIAVGPTYMSDGGDPEAIAQAQSETLDDRVDTLSRGLLGLTVSCARCHDHKFDPIPQLDYYSLAGVFRNSPAAQRPLAAPEVVKKYDAQVAAIKKVEARPREIRRQAKNENRPLKDSERAEIEELERELERLKKQQLDDFALAHTLADTGKADLPLAIRGNLLKPGPIAPRRFLRIIEGENAPLYTRGSGRLDLVDSILSPQNPLTSRVIVNRVFRQHFGQALVRTPSNFGRMGERPTHPELLDWLAAELMQPTAREDSSAVPWSLKHLHRLIVTSAAYRMSSELNPGEFAADGDNRLLWRMNPRQLDVEAWRDALLTVTGELDRELGGPSIDRLEDNFRRTMYLSVSRNGDRFKTDAFMRLFDFPAPRATSEGRPSSVVPQQSLFLMNNPFIIARAKALAARLQQMATDDAQRIDAAYQLLYSRAVTDNERRLGLAFLQSPVSGDSKSRLEPWEQYAQVLLSASEFMHLE